MYECINQSINVSGPGFSGPAQPGTGKLEILIKFFKELLNNFSYTYMHNSDSDCKREC